MGILSFDTPKRLRTTEEHNGSYQSDCGIPGTYVPNMSKEDMLKWNAKHIKGTDERIEIRKTVNSVQMVVKVFKSGNIEMSANGKLCFDFRIYGEFNSAINEALQAFKIKVKECAGCGAFLNEYESFCPIRNEGGVTYYDNRCRKCRKEYVQKHRAEKVSGFVAALGGKCSVCGHRDSNPFVFYFKHKNGYDGKINSLIKDTALTKNEKYIKDCKLICANCLKKEKTKNIVRRLT